MTAYYNEIDPKAAAWLRELIKQGHIAEGTVDERSIADVKPGELVGYTQCHFFAGIGVWSYALRTAGWPDDRPVWTGSCPCQPFSAAGKRGGTSDVRHLWPEFFRLINERRPLTVFGEQVASKDGLTWLDSVHADLEGAGYTVGAVDTCAAGFGAPHIRQRLYFVADASDGDGWPGERGTEAGTRPDGERRRGPASSRADGIVADTDLGEDRRLHGGREDRGEATEDVQGARRREERRVASSSGAVNGFWRDAAWTPCRDGKARPIEPGTFPLAHGAPARVGRLRGYGNCIVAPQAIAFVESYMEVVS